ncbi:MAG: hypothetical protein H7A23_26280 [Leptospiraceae bacterium]|nr:hypothetical protein [Leptospiraceae bacterium]
MDTAYKITNELLNEIKILSDQNTIESRIEQSLQNINTNEIQPIEGNYYSELNYHLLNYALKAYKNKEENICLWRFLKKISPRQLNLKDKNDTEVITTDNLCRLYYCSAPLEDLTCLFVPITDVESIDGYLEWIEGNFYNVNYPTSILWLYALDSSLSSMFPDEIVYLGKVEKTHNDKIMTPDFGYENTILFKRFSSNKNLKKETEITHLENVENFIKLKGIEANREFEQIFSFLKREFRDRCLSRSGKREETQKDTKKESEKLKEVLLFGVSDKVEEGCISFSDLRSSTSFLNQHGKNFYRNKIQQPFFEQTKLISSQYNGRIDKFMGDSVMCIFLKDHSDIEQKEFETETVLNNFFAIFDLCKILNQLLIKNNMKDSILGLRSGISFGKQILRSNLGNEIVRDFTVTGEDVNLAARLEHISIYELMINNKKYFDRAINRFPEIRALVSLAGNFEKLNPQTKKIIEEYTIYENIISNLEKLEKVRFDIRINESFYERLKVHFEKKGFKLTNKENSHIMGFEEYETKSGYKFQFYFCYYNPKGFSDFQRMWILPIETEMLEKISIKDDIL